MRAPDITTLANKSVENKFKRDNIRLGGSFLDMIKVAINNLIRENLHIYEI